MRRICFANQVRANDFLAQPSGLLLIKETEFAAEAREREQIGSEVTQQDRQKCDHNNDGDSALRISPASSARW